MRLPILSYLGLMLSVIALDAVVLLIYGVVSNRLGILPGIYLNHSLPCAIGLMLGALALSHWVHHPVHFLDRLRRLPLLSGLFAGGMLMIHEGFLFRSGDLISDPGKLATLPPGILIGALIWYLAMFGLLYGYFGFALASGMVTSIRARLWHQSGIELPARAQSSIAQRLIVAFLFTLALPAALLLSDFTWLWGVRMAQGLAPLEIVILDTTASAVVLSVSVAVVLRGMLLSLRQIEDGQHALALGDSKGLAVLSDDELGRIAEGFNRMRLAVQEREFLRTAFSTYVGEDRSRQLLTTDRQSSEPAEVSIMFTDIAGFTRIAETLPPDTLVQLLRAYFSDVVSIVEKHGGGVDNFVGDAIVAVFRQRASGPTHAARALMAAREIAEMTMTQSFIGIALPTRIGVHTGSVVTGEVGNASRRGISVFGDAVNVAARLEAANKDLGSTILASAATINAVTAWQQDAEPGNDRAHPARDFTPCGSVQLRGRKEPMDVWGWSSPQG